MPIAPQQHRHLMIAIPLFRGDPARMLGQCDKVQIFQIDWQEKKVLYESIHEAPPHDPGQLPLRLDQLGIDVILTGEMGRMAQNFFEKKGIAVVLNVQAGTPTQIVSDFMDGKLTAGELVRGD